MSISFIIFSYWLVGILGGDLKDGYYFNTTDRGEDLIARNNKGEEIILAKYWHKNV